jgi:hypothetical protein
VEHITTPFKYSAENLALNVAVPLELISIRRTHNTFYAVNLRQRRVPALFKSSCQVVLFCIKV